MEREQIRANALAILTLMVADLRQEMLDDAKETLGELASQVDVRMTLKFSDAIQNNIRLEIDFMMTEMVWSTMAPEIINALNGRKEQA